MQIKEFFKNQFFICFFLVLTTSAISVFVYDRHVSSHIFTKEIFLKTMILEDKINKTDFSLRLATLSLGADIGYIGSKDIEIDDMICNSLNSSNIDKIAKIVKPKIDTSLFGQEIEGVIVDKKFEREMITNFNNGVLIIKKNCTKKSQK